MSRHDVFLLYLISSPCWIQRKQASYLTFVISHEVFSCLDFHLFHYTIEKFTQVERKEGESKTNVNSWVMLLAIRGLWEVDWAPIHIWPWLWVRGIFAGTSLIRSPSAPCCHDHFILVRAKAQLVIYFLICRFSRDVSYSKLKHFII